MLAARKAAHAIASASLDLRCFRIARGTKSKAPPKIDPQTLARARARRQLQSVVILTARTRLDCDVRACTGAPARPDRQSGQSSSPAILALRRFTATRAIPRRSL